MEKHGMEYMIVSSTGPGARGFGDKAEAKAFAREGNDYMSKGVSKNPKQFGAFYVNT